MDRQVAPLTVDTLVENYFNDHVTRARIEELEAIIAQMPQAEFPLGHQFVKGLYCRTVLLPKGSLIAGKLHVQSHFCVIPCGDVLTLTEQGPQRITGPFLYASLPGTKRIIYALEDTVWTNLVATDETDPTVIENTLMLDTFAQWDAYQQTHPTEPVLPPPCLEEGNLSLSPRRQRALCKE